MTAAPDPVAVAVAAGHLAARWGLDAAALGEGAVRRAVSRLTMLAGTGLAFHGLRSLANATMLKFVLSVNESSALSNCARTTVNFLSSA